MYRYSQEIYNSALLSKGQIRIGTLHDFRDSEHARGIADPTEGKKDVIHTIDILHHTDLEKRNKHLAALSQFNIFGGDPSHINMTNCQFIQKFDEPNCYVLCTSLYHSTETMAEFGGADSCVRIVDTNQFYKAITKALSLISPVVWRGAYKVKYQERSESWNGRDWGHHPALIKEPEFEKQGEIRAIWTPSTDAPISPVIISAAKLGSFCRIAPF